VHTSALEVTDRRVEKIIRIVEEGSEMRIVLTYDPRWEYTPEDHIPFWESLDTVDYVAELLEETGNTVLRVETDDTFEFRLEIMNKYSGPLVFWLNEFMPTDSGKKLTAGRPFTVSVIEKVGMMHTGPGSEALGIGLDKEATKDVFRRLGLPTPESYVVYPGDYSPIYQNGHWDSYVIIKPLLQGNSRGMDEFSVVGADDYESIRARVERIHHEFDEPALVERYIGGKNAKEFTVPMLISHNGRMTELPIIEFDLSRIPVTQRRFRFLTHDIKDEDYYLIKIPAELPPEITRRIHSDVGRIIREIGCRDMTRVDMRGDSTVLYYIEVNVNPGKDRFNSYLPRSAYSLGLDYPEIIAFIPYQAMLKYGLEPPRELEELMKPVTALFDTIRAVAASF